MFSCSQRSPAGMLLVMGPLCMSLSKLGITKAMVGNVWYWVESDGKVLKPEVRRFGDCCAVGYVGKTYPGDMFSRIKACRILLAPEADIRQAL